MGGVGGRGELDAGILEGYGVGYDKTHLAGSLEGLESVPRKCLAHRIIIS